MTGGGGATTVEAVAVTLEYAGGAEGAGAAVVGAAGEGATAEVDGGAGTGARSVGSEDWWATVITAITNAASTTIPSALSTAEVQRRSLVKSGNAMWCESTAADHGLSTSAPKPRS